MTVRREMDRGDLGHSVAEMLPVDELRRAVTWVALLIAEYCGVARRPLGP
jgi:acetylornithine deacetylase/succinyl-diaminopimelate desuccinylase-like protein